jgi:hypothetical protein
MVLWEERSKEPMRKSSGPWRMRINSVHCQLGSLLPL